MKVQKKPHYYGLHYGIAAIAIIVSGFQGLPRDLVRRGLWAMCFDLFCERRGPHEVSQYHSAEPARTRSVQVGHVDNDVEFNKALNP